MKRKEDFSDQNDPSKRLKTKDLNRVLLSNASKRGVDAFNKMKEALDSGADINATNKNGRSVIAVAAASGASLEVIEFLLERRADPKISDNNGNNALYHAIFNCHASVRIISTLLRTGMDVNDVDNNILNSIFEHCTGKVWEFLMTKLRFSAESHNDLLHRAIVRTVPEPSIIVKLMHEYGYSLDAKNIDGYTPWQLLLLKFKSEGSKHNYDSKNSVFSKIMLEYNFDTTVLTPEGFSALDLLAMCLKKCNISNQDSDNGNLAEKLTKHFIECGARVGNDTQGKPIYYVVKSLEGCSPKFIMNTFFILAGNGVSIPSNTLSLYVNSYLDMIKKNLTYSIGFHEAFINIIKDLINKYGEKLDSSIPDEESGGSSISNLHKIYELYRYTYNFINHNYRKLMKAEHFSYLNENHKNIYTLFISPYQFIKTVDRAPLKFDEEFNPLFDEVNLVRLLYRFWDGDAFIKPSKDYMDRAVPCLLKSVNPEFIKLLIEEATKNRDINTEVKPVCQAGSSSSLAKLVIEEVKDAAADVHAETSAGNSLALPPQDLMQEDSDVTMTGDSIAH